MEKTKNGIFLTLVLMFSINTLHARNIGDVSIETMYGKYTLEEKLNDYNEKLETIDSKPDTIYQGVGIPKINDIVFTKGGTVRIIGINDTNKNKIIKS